MFGWKEDECSKSMLVHRVSAIYQGKGQYRDHNREDCRLVRQVSSHTRFMRFTYMIASQTIQNPITALTALSSSRNLLCPLLFLHHPSYPAHRNPEHRLNIAPLPYAAFRRTFQSMLAAMLLLRRLLLPCLLLPIVPVSTKLVNITVDDTFGNPDRSVIPTYLPANDTWHTGSPGEQCAVCTIKPSELDTSQIFDQSWHHGSYLLNNPISVQVTFPGTAVYVYNVVPNTIPGANTFMNISFAIDGETVGQFLHVPDSISEIMYNHLVYANTTLSDSPHTLVMSASGSNESFIFFDYLLYTTEVDGPAIPASPTSSTTTVRLGPGEK